MAYNWRPPLRPFLQDADLAYPPQIFTSVGPPLQYARSLDLIYYPNQPPPPPPFYDMNAMMPPRLYSVSCPQVRPPIVPHGRQVILPHGQVMMNAAPLYYQWQNVVSEPGRPPHRILVPVYLERTDAGVASGGQVRPRSLPAEIHASPSIAEGRAAVSNQECPIPGHKIAQQDRKKMEVKAIDTKVEINDKSLSPTLGYTCKERNPCTTTNASKTSTVADLDTSLREVFFRIPNVEYKKTYADAVQMYGPPTPPPFFFPNLEIDTDYPELDQASHSPGSSECCAEVLRDISTKGIRYASGVWKDIFDWSDSKYPLEPDSYFTDINMSVLLDYVNNVSPGRRMAYTEGFVFSNNNDSYSPISIYDHNHGEDLPREIRPPEMYHLEQRLHNEDAAAELCKALKIDKAILKRYAKAKEYSVYMVTHHPQIHPLWIELHKPQRKLKPSQEGTDEAFSALGTNPQPCDLLNAFLDTLMEYNYKLRAQVNPTSNEMYLSTQIDNVGTPLIYPNEATRVKNNQVIIKEIF